MNTGQKHTSGFSTGSPLILDKNKHVDDKLAYDLICEGFMWFETKEAHGYWRDVVDNLYDILHKKKYP